MKVYQIGSSIKHPDQANDLDLVIVCDKPVDICFYTEEEWKEFEANGKSDKGHRVVAYPPCEKGTKLNGDILRLL